MRLRCANSISIFFRWRRETVYGPACHLGRQALGALDTPLPVRVGLDRAVVDGKALAANQALVHATAQARHERTWRWSKPSHGRIRGPNRGGNRLVQGGFRK
jgi:hypothetical protein